MKQKNPISKTMGRINLILAQDFEPLGKKDDEVSVRAGYFMNYLLPRGIAYRASDVPVVKKSHRRRLSKHFNSTTNQTTNS